MPTRGWSEKHATRNADAGCKASVDDGDAATSALYVSAVEMIISAESWIVAGHVGGPVTNVDVQPAGVCAERFDVRAAVITDELFGFKMYSDTSDDADMALFDAADAATGAMLDFRSVYVSARSVIVVESQASN